MDIGDYVISGQKNGSLEFGSIGKTYGEKTHLQTVAEMASHTHIQDAHIHGLRIKNAGSGTYGEVGGGDYSPTGYTSYVNANPMYYTTATNQYSGGNTPFNVIQPTRAALCVIKT